MAKKKKMSMAAKKAVHGYLFILPFILGFAIFYVKSLAQTIIYAFSETSFSAMTGLVSKWVGFKNFVYIFTEHGSFKQEMVSSLSDMLIDVPLILFFSLFMAMMLNRKFKGRSVVRAIFFLPIILGSGAIAAALQHATSMMQGGLSTSVTETSGVQAGVLAFDIDYIINTFRNLGLNQKVLGYVVSAVARINDIISNSGVQIIIFIAALQSIPGSMYEVAKIEGATGYETFWKVTFPMVMPHIITNIVFTIVEAFADSKVIQLAEKEYGFAGLHYGYSMAITLVSTLITVAILLVIIKIIQRFTFYYT